MYQYIAIYDLCINISTLYSFPYGNIKYNVLHYILQYIPIGFCFIRVICQNAKNVAIMNKKNQAV